MLHTYKNIDRHIPHLYSIYHFRNCMEGSMLLSFKHYRNVFPFSAHRELSWAEPRWAFRLIIWWAELSRAELDFGSPKWAELSRASAHPSELSWAGHRLTPPELSWAFDRLSSAQLKICLINSWLSSAQSSWAFRLTFPSLTTTSGFRYEFFQTFTMCFWEIQINHTSLQNQRCFKEKFRFKFLS